MLSPMIQADKILPPKIDTVKVLGTTILSAINVPTFKIPLTGNNVANHDKPIRSSNVVLCPFAKHLTTITRVITASICGSNNRISERPVISSMQSKPYSCENPTGSKKNDLQTWTERT
mmetsp:Transcript_27636/g.36709  ORF Transcript_27636/g.36709 Transcript_27636/m.36709 type:complete len:118 (-) Transcript_27636:1075-1428(-)